ncbi:hypothetical protein B0H10DRAFT_1959146 [Mycena sp. CBHHK59/15]|nr:hypothetical protein B0H10DRAFT_1959146 [Mycena sp. CBHHK59/15]
MHHNANSTAGPSGAHHQLSPDPKSSQPEEDYPQAAQDFALPPSPEGTPAPRAHKNYHPFLNARPCDENGNFLPDGAAPPPRTTANNDDWTPFEGEVSVAAAWLGLASQSSRAKPADYMAAPVAWLRLKPAYMTA